MRLLRAFVLAAGALACVAGCRIAENAASAPASVRGRAVFAAGGEPAAGARVDLLVGGHEDARVSTEADPAGRFRIDGLHEATHDLTIEADGRVGLRCVDLRGGEDADLGDIALFRPTAVSGRIERDGRPLPGAHVTVIPDDALRSRLLAAAYGLLALETDPDGAFGLPEVLGARVAVIVGPRESEGALRLFIAALPDGGGAVELALAWEAGEPWTLERQREPLFPE